MSEIVDQYKAEERAILSSDTEVIVTERTLARLKNEIAVARAQVERLQEGINELETPAEVSVENPTENSEESVIMG